MSDQKETVLNQMTHLAEELTEVAVAGQAAGLQLLQAEMQALAALVPGITPAAARQTDAEIEADFDNMPV